jgi:tetratricopeptide (TPR) repeat protein
MNLACLAAALALALHAAPLAAEPVTFAKAIAPLIADRCAMCHHPGGPAPFALLTYADVKRHATQIAATTKSRFMPPWKADPRNGPFVGQHPLSDAEVALVDRWIADGTVEGDPADLPKALGPGERGRRWTGGWQLGTPDLVLTLPQPFTLPAEGTDVFRIFTLPIAVDRGRFVRGLEFRPGNASVVHHANIRVDATPGSRRRDEEDPAPGYEGLLARSAEYPDGHFLGWTPGQVSPLLPPDQAWRLAAGSDLVVELHMQPSGKAESVAPSVGLYFDDAAPFDAAQGRPFDAAQDRPFDAAQGRPRRTPAMLRLGRQNIDIPAGEANYTITDSYVLPVDVEVIALQPHAHYRLRRARGEAALPDGSITPLIEIADWDFRWQHVYRFVTPLRLPKGTTLSMRYTYDNSAANARNPQQPPGRARWGQRSSDEMGDLWIQVLTRDARDLDRLTREFRPKVAAEDVRGYEMEIERHPDDTGLHDSVALLYLELGRAGDAVGHFERSLALKPQSAAAHYNLGTALTLARRLDEAADRYRAALRIDPAYAVAHNNLGNVLLAQGKHDEAIREFREVVRLQPDSAAARKNLEAALALVAPRKPR